jgi:hypothetical protein
MNLMLNPDSLHDDQVGSSLACARAILQGMSEPVSSAQNISSVLLSIHASRLATVSNVATCPRVQAVSDGTIVDATASRRVLTQDCRVRQKPLSSAIFQDCLVTF